MEITTNSVTSDSSSDIGTCDINNMEEKLVIDKYYRFLSKISNRISNGLDQLQGIIYFLSYKIIILFICAGLYICVGMQTISSYDEAYKHVSIYDEEHNKLKEIMEYRIGENFVHAISLLCEANSSALFEHHPSLFKFIKVNLNSLKIEFKEVDIFVQSCQYMALLNTIFVFLLNSPWSSNIPVLFFQVAVLCVKQQRSVSYLTFLLVFHVASPLFFIILHLLHLLLLIPNLRMKEEIKKSS